MPIPRRLSMLWSTGSSVLLRPRGFHSAGIWSGCLRSGREPGKDSDGSRGIVDDERSLESVGRPDGLVIGSVELRADALWSRLRPAGTTIAHSLAYSSRSALY